MHEYSLVQALVDRIEQEAKARDAVRVHAVRVRIGELAGVDSVLLATAYQTFTKGTICEGVPLELVSAPAQWECKSCLRAIAKGEKLQCPTCGSPARLVQGDEIVLDRLELETA